MVARVLLATPEGATAQAARSPLLAPPPPPPPVAKGKGRGRGKGKGKGKGGGKGDESM